jgi:hypothetical protein
MNTPLRLFVAFMLIGSAATVQAETAYYEVPLRSLELVDGQLPAKPKDPARRYWMGRAALTPRIVIDGEAEAYLANATGNYSSWLLYGATLDRIRVHVRAAKDKDVTGSIYLPHPDKRAMVSLRFKIPAASADASTEASFREAKRSHYRRLRDRGIPGTAWFRHQEFTAGQRQKDTEPRPAAQRNRWRQQRELDRTYALFTGGRAVSENLQFDREMLLRGDDIEKVQLDSIRGIRTAPIDWSELIKGLHPQIDPLAKYIPEDQHVVFFPSFSAAVKLADEATELGTPILRSVEPKAVDARTRQRYERQLGCSMSSAARILGPRLVKSIAITGSDPYYRTGTDVAVLFETHQPGLLAKLLGAQVGMTAVTVPDAKVSSGEIAGLNYQLVRSPDRTICSYLVKLDDAVLLTNSPCQIERLAEARTKKRPTINSTPEYRFFRSRYPLGDKNETALLIISDATIRRWCGPRWRIATSRRTRAAAMLAEVQAAQMDKLAGEKPPRGAIHTNWPTDDVGELTLSPAGVRSSTQGTLRFLTPIAEIPMTEVTKSEAQAYERWRDGYESNWNVGFDPIAFRISVSNEALAGDLTVMPLISATRYRELIRITSGASFQPTGGDPHDTLLQLVLAVNKNSREFRRAHNWAGATKAGMGLGWLGDSVSIYLEDGPFWKELAAQSHDERKQGNYLMNHFDRIPIAVRADVANGLHLVGFLTSFRAWLEQTAPGTLTWEAIEKDGQTYVKVSATEKGAALFNREDGEHTLFYATSNDALIISFDEGVLQRALAREKRRREAKKAEADGKPAQPEARPAVTRTWLGKNVALHADRRILDILENALEHQYRRAMQAEAWNNLPILNEWRRRYPGRDPVATHEKLWGIRLVCPGGGRYVWNEKWQTMESTVYGHPGEPKDGPGIPALLNRFQQADFGLTFENNGLRAKARLGREKETSKHGEGLKP